VWVALVGLAIALYVGWQLSSSIAAGSYKAAIMLAAGFFAFFLAGRIADDWRSGVYIFFVWLLFEDLIRKYTGNNMTVYFGKDVLVLVTYSSFIVDRTKAPSLRSVRRSGTRWGCSFYCRSCRFLIPIRPAYFMASSG